MAPMVARGGRTYQDDGAPLTPLGEFMQRRNADLGLSVAEVAQRVGMSRATWYRIARGTCVSPSIRLLRGLARVYKVRAADLFALASGSDSRPPSAPVEKNGGMREAGDVVWRCRHERRVQAGSWVDVKLELLNLSDRTWLGLEVRGLHDAWLTLGAEHPRRARTHRHGREPLPCRAVLAAAHPGDWVHAALALQAPREPATSVFCLSLYAGASTAPIGAGALLVVETV